MGRWILLVRDCFLGVFLCGDHIGAVKRMLVLTPFTLVIVRLELLVVHFDDIGG